MNSPVLTGYGDWRLSGPLNVSQARAALAGRRVQSAIGHAGSAMLLSRLLEREVEPRRMAVKMQPDDAALVLRLLDRLPEGVVLDERQLAARPYELAWLEYLRAPAALEVAAQQA